MMPKHFFRTVGDGWHNSKSWKLSHWADSGSSRSGNNSSAAPGSATISRILVAAALCRRTDKPEPYWVAEQVETHFR